MNVMWWLVILTAAMLCGVVWFHARKVRELRTGILLEQQERAEVERLHLGEVTQLRNQQTILFESMAEGVLVLDAADRVLIANRSFMSLFGVPQDVTGRTLMEAVRVPAFATLVREVRESRQLLGRELRVDVPSERWLEVNGAAVPLVNPVYAVVVLVFHDYTRIKKLENTRKEFVANVSHELRTPLSLIQGAVETLLDGAKDDAEAMERFLGTIERNTKRLKLLMDDLLVISELELGAVALHRRTMNLQAAAEKVIHDLLPKAKTRNVTIRNTLPELLLEGDAARIEQVFSNLIDNAIKYGKPGGQIVVGGGRNLGRAEIFVRDDGPGIPAEALMRVFERFYRVDKGRSREQGGTGLGLAIVKHLVQAHGGRAWAESGEGAGATFWFTLPLPLTGTANHQ